MYIVPFYWIDRGVTQRCSYESRYEGSHTRAEAESMYRAASDAMDQVGKRDQASMEPADAVKSEAP